MSHSSYELYAISSKDGNILAHFPIGTLVNQGSRFSLLNFVDLTDDFNVFTHKEDTYDGSYQYSVWNYDGVIAHMKNTVNYHDASSPPPILEARNYTPPPSPDLEDDIEVIHLSKERDQEETKEEESDEDVRPSKSNSLESDEESSQNSSNRSSFRESDEESSQNSICSSSNRSSGSEKEWSPPCRTNKIYRRDDEIEFEYNEHREYEHTIRVLRFIDECVHKYRDVIDFVVTKIKYEYK